MFEFLLFVIIFVSYLYLAFPESFEQPTIAQIAPTSEKLEINPISETYNTVPNSLEPATIDFHIPCISNTYESEFLDLLHNISNSYSESVLDALDVLNSQTIRTLKSLASTVKLPKYGKMTKNELTSHLSNYSEVLALI